MKTLTVSMILWALVCLSVVVANGQGVPTPVPDPATNQEEQSYNRVDGFNIAAEEAKRQQGLTSEPVGGPISDLIEKRIEKRVQDNLERKQESRLGVLLSEIKASREERNGLISRVANLSERLQAMRAEDAEERAEARERWQPIKNLANLLRWTFLLLVLVTILFALDRVSSIFKRR